ncbi:MAG: polymer-forming cytoskeletal protein [Bacteroidota bacterium]|nr:polymer-forming cytoskeletal protein [Bacteroidota bacterium]
MLKNNKSVDRNTFESKGNSSLNLIGNGTEIVGDIKVKGDLRVDGKVSGNIQCESKVVLGAHGMVKGNIVSAHADISGTVNGNLRIDGFLFLKSGGTVNGDLEIRNLVVEENGVFNGQCTMLKKGKEMHGNLMKENIEKKVE